MGQGYPHRSILPHIFPDCNSFAIKIGGKFCGVWGVCPGGGLPRRCRRGGRQRYPAGGLPALSPAYPAFNLFPCPHPPDPLPGGKGVTIGYFMQGAAPLASPGLNPRGTGYPRPGGEDHLKRRSSSPPVPPLLGCRHCSEERTSAGSAPNRRLLFARHLHGGNCKCRKRFNAGVPGAVAPGEINL